MNANELISSTILSDVEIIADIFHIVKEAGLSATNNPTVKSAQNNVCVLKPNQLGRTRLTEECRKTREYSIKYDANDITIVGGAALNIYDYKLRVLKERRALEALDNYIKKKTSDIDIVWWPRSASKKEIITSKSEAIVQLALVFREELQQKFNDAIKELEAKIKPYITNASNSDELSIYVEMFQTRPAGVFNMNVRFQIKDKVLKICDISLHDAGAGQRYDADGKEITAMQFMTEDPVYCNPSPGYMNSIKYLNVNGIDIGVSNIHAFVNQQMLAFDNLIRIQNPKSLINYKRVEFVKKLLDSFQLRSQYDRQNYTELFEVFGTRHADYPTFMITEIDKRVEVSMLKLYKPILELCGTINTTNDTIVRELCVKARIAEDSNKYSNEDFEFAKQFVRIEIDRLTKLKDTVWRRYKSSPTSQIKREYETLHKKIDNRLIKVMHMLPSEILEYKIYYDTHPDEDIEEMERINKITKQYHLNVKKSIEAKRVTTPATTVTPPSFIPAFHEVNVVQYGYAPRYSPPTFYAQYYIEPITGRHMQYDPRGFWYYLTPPLATVAPPLPRGPPPPLPREPPPGSYSMQQKQTRRGPSQYGKGIIQTRKKYKSQ